MKNSDSKLNFDRGIEILVLNIMLIVSALLCIFQFFDHDEFEAIHTTWKIFKGQVIYIDFFQQKPPFFHITMIPLLKIFSETIRALFACKIFCYMLFLGIVYATYLVSKYVFGSKIKLLTPIILLSCTFFTDKLTEIRPDTLYIMLIMFAIAFLYKNIKIKKTNLIISALLAGASFAVLPKAIFYIFPISLILLFRLYKKKISITDLLLYGLITLIPIILSFIYFLSKSINFEQYWFFNFLINYKFMGAFSSKSFFLQLLYENGIFLFTAIIGLFCLKGYRQKEIGVMSVILFLSVFLINVPNKQYFVPAMPFFAMISANTINKIQNKYNFSVIISLLLIIFYPLQCLFKEIQNYKNSSQLDVINYVLNTTNKDDKIYDGSIYFNIYRDDVDYFWFSVRPKGAAETYRSFKPRDYDIYKDIKEKKPKIINIKYLDIENEEIKNNYTPITEYNFRRNRIMYLLYKRKDNNENIK